jgi:HEAT repeat protein
MTNAPYAPPVDRLLRLGDQGRDYRVMGLTEEHVPELLRMAADRTLGGPGTPSAQRYARWHAWNALGQLGDPRAVEPLLAVLVEEYEDDEVFDVLPAVLGQIGAAALPDLRALLADPSADGDLRIAAANAVSEAGHAHPDARDEAVEALTWQLRSWAEQSEFLNGFLIGYLADFKAVEAAPLMREAFEAGAVDELVRGDWEDVQIELGMLEGRITEPRQPEWGAGDGPAASPASRASARAKAKEKSRRKAARASRKRNRKRK